MNDRTHGRFYLKFNDRDSSYASELRGNAGDHWKALRGGFRVDGQVSEKDSWTVQGDIYDTNQNQILRHKWVDPSDPANSVYAPFYDASSSPDIYDSSGWNLLTRWNHVFSESSSSSLKIYFDHTDRSEFLLDQLQSTLDIDYQHRFQPMEYHDVVWGLGYRRINDEFKNTFAASIFPEEADTELFSAFLQDEIELVPERFHLTLGSKFEHNEFTGLEVQPSIRLHWQVNENTSYWGSVSRAVRTPSRMENGSSFVARILPPIPGVVPFPIVLKTSGNSAVDSEDMIAYELGFRTQPRENISLDLTLFYNDYDNLLTFENNIPSVPSPEPINSLFGNKGEMHSYGLELAADWRPQEWWRLQLSYSYIRLSGDVDNDSLDDVSIPTLMGSTPRHQVSLRSSMDLTNNWSLDMWTYWIDQLNRSSLSVMVETPAYLSLNARIAWRPMDQLELSLSGQNLLDSRHPEFVAENLLIKTEVERSVMARVRWEF